MFKNIYKNKTVFVTGHTGFKGSWLVLWLKFLGANVIGYSLEPPTTPNHYSLLNLDITSIIGDIRDREKLSECFDKFQPDIVFHLAAQPIVGFSYLKPHETFEVNVLGTLNVFDCSRETESVKAIVNITSDKCYENQEWYWGYREIDRLGGDDPYSASKACAEIITHSYRISFFRNINKLIASARAGNVIGGGDWAKDRLIPDIIRSTSENKPVLIRNLQSIRPWQHVLEPLSGYLFLGQRLLEGKCEFAEAWNFGPHKDDERSVEYIVQKSKKFWDKIEFELNYKSNSYKESKILKLDCAKAMTALKWKPIWNIDKALQITIDWYKNFYENKKIITLINFENYIEDAKKNKAAWIEEN